MFELNDATVAHVVRLMYELDILRQGVARLTHTDLEQVPLDVVVRLQRVLTEADMVIETAIGTTYQAIQHHPER